MGLGVLSVLSCGSQGASGLQVQYLCETTKITSHYVIFAGAPAD